MVESSVHEGFAPREQTVAWREAAGREAAMGPHRLLPILFKKRKLDSALMSRPFIAGVVDVLCLFTYLQISTMIIGQS